MFSLNQSLWKILTSLQIKRDKYYAVLSWYEGEKRKQKRIATGLPVKGNKRRAEALLKQELDHDEVSRMAGQGSELAKMLRNRSAGYNRAIEKQRMKVKQ